MEHRPTMNAAFLAIAVNKTIMVYRSKVCSEVSYQCECRVPISNKLTKMRMQIHKERESKRGKEEILSELLP